MDSSDPRTKNSTFTIISLPLGCVNRANSPRRGNGARQSQAALFFTAGKDLDRYVIWDYLKRRREIVA